MNITLKNSLKIAAAAFVLFLCIFYWSSIAVFLGKFLSAINPIIIGFAIAFVLNILMSFYESHYFTKFSSKKIVRKTRRPVCLTGAILTLLLIVALVVYLVVPELVSCVKFLIAEIPPMIEKILKYDWVRRLLPSDILQNLASIDWMQHMTKIIQTVTSGLGDAFSIVINTVTSVVSGLFTAFLSIIFSVYLLSGKEKLLFNFKNVMKKYMPKRVVEKTSYAVSVLDDSFRRYIVGQCTEAVVLGVLCILGMLIFRFPYAVMIGTLIGFTALIPVAGAYIGAAVGAIIILTDSPIKALLFIVFIIVLQQIEGNLIYPKVVGKSIGLPAVWVLAAVTVGGGLMGILGMLLGVPIVAALYRMLKDDMTDSKTQ
jgi:predicted PurR-regulated permease PerM